MADEQPSNSLENDSSSLEAANSTSSLEAGVGSTGKIVDKKPEAAKLPFIKRLTQHLNIYLLLFILLLVLAGGIVIATYLASKTADKSSVKTQTLTSDTLKQLATNDVTVGQPKQVLNVQSNAVFAGKVLIRDSLEVAGPISVGGALNVPGITVSGNSIFEQLQVNKGLSVAGDTALQGLLSVQRNLTVAGTGTFGGNVSAPQITTNTLQLNGNLSLTRHLAVGGSTPSRTNGNALGGGGTVAVSGSDIGGSININTGSGPSAGCFTTVTFTTRYNSTPRVNVTPVGSAAGSIGYYIERNNSSFSVCANQAAPANTSFGFDYFIVE
jgi:cytoskeletal protein CcmA (bactofilin family)